MPDRVRLQIKVSDDPEVWEDVGDGEGLVRLPVSGSDYVIQLKTDSIDSDVQYLGYADADVGTDESLWQIFKIDSTTGIEITSADGDFDFNNEFDERESLNYS